MTTEVLDRSRALELSREVDDALDQLWAAGKISIVLRLLLEDCERLLQAWRSTPDARQGELEALDTLCQRGLSLGTPALERELSPAHRELLGQLAAVRRRCVARLRGSGTRGRQVRRLAAATALAALAIGGFFVFRNVPTAQASATYASDFPASQALDGLTKTEWLLPDKQNGWLELVFSRPRSVSAVRLRNSANGGYHDRATKAFKLEAFADAELVATAHGQFPPIADDQGPLTVPLMGSNVTRVRVTIDSHYGLGAGLAEVQVR